MDRTDVYPAARGELPADGPSRGGVSPVLVTGASGTLGRRVVRRLLDGGVPVRAVTRDPSRVADLVEAGAEVVRGDLLVGTWLDPAISGVGQVVIASHGLVPPDRRNHPGAVDGTGARRLVDAASRAGVRHVVHVSVAGADRVPTLFAREKRATEEHLARSDVPHTILRPTVFLENQLLLAMGEPLRGAGEVTLFGPGTTPLNWISAADVAAAVVEAVGAPPEGGGRVRTIGGPDVLSRLEALAVLEEVLGRKARRKHVPVLGMRLMRAVVGSFHPGMRYLVDLALSEAADDGSLPSTPDSFDWIGDTRLRSVVEEWARG